MRALGQGPGVALWRRRLSAESETHANLRFLLSVVRARLRFSARQLALAWLSNCRSTPRGWAVLLRILAHCSRALMAHVKCDRNLKFAILLRPHSLDGAVPGRFVPVLIL